MRTLMLVGIVAGSLIGATAASAADTQDTPTLDYGVPGSPDERVYTGAADRVPGEADYRGEETPPQTTPDAIYSGNYDADGRWTGNGTAPGADYAGSYDADGQWTGTWEGTYRAPDGRLYQGQYQGTVEGRPGVGYAPPAPTPPGTHYATTYPGGGQGQGYSYAAGAYSPGSVTITTQPPVVTETVETTTETFYD